MTEHHQTLPGGEVMPSLSKEQQGLVDKLTRDVITHAADIGIAARHQRVSSSERAERILSHFAELGGAIDALVYQTEVVCSAADTDIDRAIDANVAIEPSR